MKPWTASDIPSQAGRLAVVTGANSGIGFQTSLELARRGARVVLASRNPAKAEDALAKIRAAAPGAKAELAALDLSDLKSVKAFAAAFLARGEALDVLVNNAGIMAPLTRQTSPDGFEIQMATNHLGHFALTALLVPALKRSAAPRVVPVASIAHKGVALDFDDLMSERRYVPWTAYGRTKLANLLFAFELQRRAEAAGWGLRSVAAHPGVARTKIVENGLGGGKAGVLTTALRVVMTPFTHSEERGALPILCAATMPDALGGAYYGPGGLREMTGDPVRVEASARAKDVAAARRLWEASEALTGTPFRL